MRVNLLIANGRKPSLLSMSIERFRGALEYDYSFSPFQVRLLAVSLVRTLYIGLFDRQSRLPQTTSNVKIIKKWWPPRLSWRSPNVAIQRRMSPTLCLWTVTRTVCLPAQARILVVVCWVLPVHNGTRCPHAVRIIRKKRILIADKISHFEII